MKNWKTTAFGVVCVIATVIAANPGDYMALPHSVITLAKLVAGVSVGLGLYKAKDSDVTGGTRAQ